MHYLLADYAVILLATYLGWRRMRTTQMSTQYDWEFVATSPLTWARRELKTDNGTKE
jgi:hypothetical protein